MNRPSKKHRNETHRIAFKPPTNYVRFQRLGSGARAWRFGDFVAACVLIAFTLPLMTIVAIAIKFESPGPVFERTPRIGSGGRRFEMRSFRTTAHGVEDRGLKWRRAAQMTRLGPYLRYTRIDALPQLINVLRGEMSIIDTGAYTPSFLD